MSQPIIEAKNVGKRYDIEHQRGSYLSLRDVLMNVARSPFKILSTKVKRAAGLERKEEFWAVKDLDFSIGRGEVVGIIGRNGAGKSTLLKLLSQITPPTTGEITVRGRVGSLLEVGTGFHPELTGRENIFLNGAILGMPRREIAGKFDRIVAFAGVEKFLDTPVKHYSSGMYVRLAFSVAAHLEPDILIVDEVLAVGDAEFQRKCLGKMDEITRTGGRTILFVSHNMGAIRQLCRTTMWMENGRVRMSGETGAVIDSYLGDSPRGDAVEARPLAVRTADGRTGELRLTGLAVAAADGSRLVRSSSGLRVSLGYRSGLGAPLPAPRVVMLVTSERSRNAVLRFDSHMVNRSLGAEIAPDGRIVCESGPIDLVEGPYEVEVSVWAAGTERNPASASAKFSVASDLAAYGYRLPQESALSERMVGHGFRQE